MNMKQRESHETAGGAWLWFLMGTAAGAVATYLLDPQQGVRRRALIRDKSVHYGRKSVEYGERLGRDLRNRATGYAAKIKARRDHEPISDEDLNLRVRSELGRAVSHAASIDTAVREGVVTLSGPILKREVDALIKKVLSVNGVVDVISRLEPHEHADRIPGLQGEGKSYLQ